MLGCEPPHTLKFSQLPILQQSLLGLGRILLTILRRFCLVFYCCEHMTRILVMNLDSMTSVDPDFVSSGRQREAIAPIGGPFSLAFQMRTSDNRRATNARA